MGFFQQLLEADTVDGRLAVRAAAVLDMVFVDRKAASFNQ
jgi:hypothetical protein